MVEGNVSTIEMEEVLSRATENPWVKFYALFPRKTSSGRWVRGWCVRKRIFDLSLASKGWVDSSWIYADLMDMMTGAGDG